MRELDDFLSQVKLNCNISDAKFWGYYSICGLLMRYRELYRSEHSLRPWDNIDNAKVCEWIHERETLWQEIEDAELQILIINGRSYDPFDINSLNETLQPNGLVYGAGYGTFNKPTFFVARLSSVRDLLDYRVLYTGSELCRDLAASPAMLQGRCIYIRPEVLSTFIWDRFQELHADRAGGLAQQMFSGYGIQKTDKPSEELYKKIYEMSCDAAEIFVLHEAGEAYEDEWSDNWHEMLGEGCDKATELFLRGIKDVRADTSSFGPLKGIIESRNSARLCFFVVFMDGIRKMIFPEIRNAYQLFLESGAWSVIEDACIAGYCKSGRLQAEVIDRWGSLKDRAAVAQYIRDAFQKQNQSKE